MSTTNLLEAIRVVKENEKIAAERYANAANNLRNPIAKELFEQLSKFEKFHYERIDTLEKSLEKKGNFITYEGKEFPLPPIFEIKAAEEPDQKSAVQIVSEAMELEIQTEKAYADLAAQITDPQGHEMFNRLSEEEHTHYRILREAYWTLTNLRVWKWPRP
jgi:rubrerythrin